MRLVPLYFNKNDGGRAAAGYMGQTGDCAARAISIASGRRYQEIYDRINEAAKRERPRKAGSQRRSSARTGVLGATMRRLMKELGFEWVPTMQIGSGCKVHLAQGELPMGRIVARVSKHFCAVIDGVIQDTSDPTREGTRCVYGYWIIS